ncbi:hypothetical protein BOTCAL_0246g00120 [Botryotinia calthae]|uniref:Uncharacterized protein n=1 Tax=Botryotinia calthae TaxID=38488 RepID=A0A4Y8CWV1_9HELO|nr:hypothetical protein BOTCAL_0246g00120 [Botryotinia calthae]
MPVFREAGGECRGGGLVEDEDVDSGIALYGEITAVGSAGVPRTCVKTAACAPPSTTCLTGDAGA